MGSCIKLILMNDHFGKYYLHSPQVGSVPFMFEQPTVYCEIVSQVNPMGWLPPLLIHN
jgi:hypothetical protein